MEKTSTDKGRLAKANINILGVAEDGEYLIWVFEYQWRAVHGTRWSKDFLRLPRGYEEDIRTAIWSRVQDLREELEG